MNTTQRYLTFFALTVVFFTPALLLAQTTGHYELLVTDLPFIKDVGAEGGLAPYLDAFFNFGIAIAVLLAVVLFIYNGVIYMTSDVVGNKEGAKKAFFSIIGGLVLALSSVVILQQINPELTNFKLFETLAEVGSTVGTDPTTPPTTPPTPDDPRETAARERFKQIGVGINNPPCTTGQTSGCTNVRGLELAEPFLGSLASAVGRCPENSWPSNCPVMLTGGTEGGNMHVTHGEGKAIFDLSIKNNNLNNYIYGTASRCSQDHEYGPLWVIKNSNTYFLDEAKSGRHRHWHVCIKMGNYCREFIDKCQTVVSN